ncbi:Antiholin-like protein LrgA [Campylobacter sputorum subsp. bubulus]|uniref:Antiholin-like protein LrgA n=1 Tax=Campylobacter sputorum subsp. sputorum TaxID=32024 RepID=A0A381DKR3_9BACT|nr:CidA/LrgA family protein [Campylobacter sputorum]ASM34552.1 murein hydrolase effector protein LrgA [Campylobacter sputorum aubsp. sputorum RM3237]ASM36209.1 murein hydrolase effector protein LrgA [Campylobacter sputorum bv. faecalis CCUG 20703]ASM37889.1 murein hydrolase effector protein LrgA [Campylobacter sputorum bv. paraureolyticus LMG 11764]KAB0580776.1 CidA/LrgA family protein [Campylobacter sputorum subsp. sputorum]MDY6121006.1 CidA/LrgA family protein [Campylobacter sputorum]
MKYLKQIMIILGISFLAEMLSYDLPGNIPSSIYGLVIMFFALYFKVIKVHQIRESAVFFIEIMPIIFIPAGVGLINSQNEILKNFFPIIAITFISTIVVMLASAFMTQIICNVTKKDKEDNL